MKSRNILLLFSILYSLFSIPEFAFANPGFWNVQAVDTMKYSRDLAREKLNDESFDSIIEQQVKNIASVGATHIALATPYDTEFLPFLKRWVASARRHNLNVWFRGNWSGWEEWFGYSKITRAEHIAKTERFILNNNNLFEDGDIFIACPECENGGPGDPRWNRDVTGHRQFLINEYETTKKAFQKIGKDVASNYFSMNGDVARLIMDKETTAELDGIITIDHYVDTPKNLAEDIRAFSELSGGRVVLGEWGAPIPDINGKMNEKQQAQWITDTLKRLTAIPELEGLNYWVNVGGSTQLWSASGIARSGVTELENFYNPHIALGIIKDIKDTPILGATIENKWRTVQTRENGTFVLPYPRNEEYTVLKIRASGYKSESISVYDPSEKVIVTLKKKQFFSLEIIWDFLSAVVQFTLNIFR